jgi:ABC-2 type transport system ATP-binding protein
LSQAFVRLDRCSRWYGEVIGLNDVTCTIGPGITALLGMNGAGKSTMMRLITGQIRPTTGQVLVMGQEPFANPDTYRHLGYCPDIDSFYEHRTGRQFVYFCARMAGFDHEHANFHVSRTLEEVGMSDRADRRIGGYSKGMRQRIKLAQAMLHDPEFILLDEPLNGLDPVGRREFMDMLHRLTEAGKGIIVSSHILFEVEQMTRSILLLHRGRLLASGDLTAIRELLDRHPHRVQIQTPQPREWASALVALPYVLNVQFTRDGLELQTREPDQFYSALPDIAEAESLKVDSLHSPDNNLESIFKYLVSDL